MKKVRIHASVVASVVVFSVLLAGLAGYNTAFASVPCVVKPQNVPYDLNYSAKTYTGNFYVSGDSNCTQAVSVMSWLADPSLYPSDSFWTTQTIYKVSSGTFGVGNHTLTVGLPVCSTDSSVLRSYQADTVATGSPSSHLSPPGTGSDYDRLQADGSSIVVNSIVLDNKCPSTKTTTTTTKTKDKKTSPHPTTTTTTSNPPPTTTTTTSTPQPKTIAFTPAPAKATSLPNTGPGTTMALIAAISVFAGLFHYLWNRPPRLRHAAPVMFHPTIGHHHPHHAPQPAHHHHKEHHKPRYFLQ